MKEEELLYIIKNSKNFDELTKKLAEVSADISTKSDHGNSILHLFLKVDFQPQLNFMVFLNYFENLLNSELDINLCDSQGRFVVDCIIGFCNYSINQKNELIQIVWKNPKFNSNAKNSNGDNGFTSLIKASKKLHLFTYLLNPDNEFQIKGKEFIKSLFKEAAVIEDPINYLQTASIDLFDAYKNYYLKIDEFMFYLQQLKAMQLPLYLEEIIVKFLGREGDKYFNLDNTDKFFDKLSAIERPNLDLIRQKIKEIANNIFRNKLQNSFDRLEFKLNFHLNNFTPVFLQKELTYLKEIYYPSTFENDSVMFAHLYRLNGLLPITGYEGRYYISLEGSRSEMSAIFMYELLTQYSKHCQSNSNIGMTKNRNETVLKISIMLLKAIRSYCIAYQCKGLIERLGITSAEVYKDILNDRMSFGAMILTGFPGHAVVLIIKDNLLIRNNSGQCEIDATSEFYEITKPEAFDSALIAELLVNSTKESNKILIQQTIHERLGLKLKDKHFGREQTVGNCAFEVLRVALEASCHLFLEQKDAKDLFKDISIFLDDFYLKEYCTRFNTHPDLPQVLMRFILASLSSEKKVPMIKGLLDSHFVGSENSLFIAEVSLMLELELGPKQSKKKYTREVLGYLRQKQNVFSSALAKRLSLLKNFLKSDERKGCLANLEEFSEDDCIFQGYSLLHIAVIASDAIAVEKLIKLLPALVKQRTFFNKDPLCFAKTRGIATLLIEAGAEIKDPKGDMALDRAIINNVVEVVETLLLYGALPTKNSACYAAENNLDILRMLLTNFPKLVVEKNLDYSTVIHTAAKCGNLEILRELLSCKGADLNGRDANGVTPFVDSLLSKVKEVSYWLLKNPHTLFYQPYRGDQIQDMINDFNSPGLKIAFEKRIV